MELISCYSHWRKPLQTENKKIIYYNFWNQSANEIWFSKFLSYRHFPEKFPNSQYVFFSTLGPINVFSVDTIIHPFCKNRKRIFFTGENVHCWQFAEYKDNMLNYGKIDLSIGFDRSYNDRYLRFPLWLLEIFPPDSNTEMIKTVCKGIDRQKYSPQRDRFCALVSGNRGAIDTGTIIRTQIVESINSINKVDCAGKLLRNTEELQTKFDNNKAEFLKQYKFYICPENLSVDGYVTEKLFHSISSGCIPIYNGSLNNPEPDVLNHDAILFWEKDGDNTQLIKKVEELWNNPALYKEFFEQPRLQPNAWEVIAEYFEQLEKKINNLFD